MLFIKFFIILPLACSIVLRKKLFNRAGKTTQWLKEFTVLTENPHLDPSNNMVSYNHLLIPTSGDPTLSLVSTGTGNAHILCTDIYADKTMHIKYVFFKENP